MNQQPEWLKKTVSSLANSRRFHVVLTGQRFAIIKDPGSTTYVDRGSGSRYFRTEFILVKQGQGYWEGGAGSGFHTVWTGRLTKEGKDVIEKALAAAEALP